MMIEDQANLTKGTLFETVRPSISAKFRPPTLSLQRTSEPDGTADSASKSRSPVSVTNVEEDRTAEYKGDFMKIMLSTKNDSI